MTLDEIIRMIAMKYPHSYDVERIIVMVNNAQQRIFRTMYKPKTAKVYDLLAGNPFYPIDFPPENIIDVVVNGKEYPHQNIQYAAQPYYYYITDESSLGIYPTPTEDVIQGLMVFHYKEPNVMSQVTDVPELDPVWHTMLVYEVCKELALIDRDERAGLFVSELNELKRQFYASRPSRPHQTLDVYGVGRGAL